MANTATICETVLCHTAMILLLLISSCLFPLDPSGMDMLIHNDPQAETILETEALDGKSVTL